MHGHVSHTRITATIQGQLTCKYNVRYDYFPIANLLANPRRLEGSSTRHFQIAQAAVFDSSPRIIGLSNFAQNLEVKKLKYKASSQELKQRLSDASIDKQSEKYINPKIEELELEQERHCLE